MNEQRLQEIKKRAEKATPGPWKVEESRYEGRFNAASVNENYDLPACLMGIEDAEFIAHARQDVPALVVEIERLQNTIALHEVNKRNLDAMIEHKDAEIERLRKALEFYADKENWERHLQCEIDVRQGQTLPIWDPSAIEFDEGETARRALAGDNQ